MLLATLPDAGAIRHVAGITKVAMSQTILTKEGIFTAVRVALRMAGVLSSSLISFAPVTRRKRRK